MNIFNSIVSRIFSHKDAMAAHAAQMQMPQATASQPNLNPASSGSAAPASNASTGSVDVMGILNAMAQKNPEKLDWQHSIVDLLKLLDLDSSHEARTELAKELNYTGNMSDSASMNIWLHQQVMKKIAENGGRVPADLLH